MPPPSSFFISFIVFAHIDGLDEENAKKIKEMIVANVRNASSK